MNDKINQSPLRVRNNIGGYLYAINTKRADPNVLGRSSNVALDGSTYSSPKTISQMIEFVKDYFTDSFSKDVYAHFGMNRTERAYSSSLRYSLAEPSDLPTEGDADYLAAVERGDMGTATAFIKLPQFIQSKISGLS